MSSCLVTMVTCIRMCDAGNDWVRTRWDACSLRCSMLCHTVINTESSWEIWSSGNLFSPTKIGKSDASDTQVKCIHSAVTAIVLQALQLLQEKWPLRILLAEHALLCSVSMTAPSCMVTTVTILWRTGTAAPPMSAPNCLPMGKARIQGALRTSGAWVCLCTPC